MRFKRLRRQREKESKNFNTRMTFSLTKGGRFFFYFGPFVLFSTMLVCPSFHHSKKKKKIFVERERDVAAEKRERFSFLVETSRTQIKHAHHHTSSQQEFFLLCDFQRHFSATPVFVSEIQRQKKQRRQFLFLLFETRFTRVRSSIVNTISIFIQRTTSGERFFL